MNSQDRSQQLEARIDRQASGAIALHSSAGGVMTIAPNNMSELMEFVKLMAVSGQCVRPVFRGNPGACLTIALQAFRTGADPFAVANKAYLVNDQIAYEAQYIHAVINTSGRLSKRLRPTYSGEGQTRRCKVIASVVGEDEPLEYESPRIAEIPVKNSPLWKSDPDQQLFYYSARAWARRHMPEIILGMYVGYETREPIDVTPPPRPTREEFQHSERQKQESEDEAPASFYGISRDGEEIAVGSTPEEAFAWLEAEMTAARDQATLEAIWIDNDALIRSLVHFAAGLITKYDVCMSRLTNQIPTQQPDPASPTPERPQVPAGPPRQVQAAPPLHPQPPGDALPVLQVGQPPIYHGAPEYRSWALAMYMPKAKQAVDRKQLTDLWVANAARIEAFKQKLPAAYIAWKTELDQVFEALPE